MVKKSKTLKKRDIKKYVKISEIVLVVAIILFIIALFYIKSPSDSSKGDVSFGSGTSVESVQTETKTDEGAIESTNLTKKQLADKERIEESESAVINLPVTTVTSSSGGGSGGGSSSGSSSSTTSTSDTASDDTTNTTQNDTFASSAITGCDPTNSDCTDACNGLFASFVGTNWYDTDFEGNLLCAEDTDFAWVQEDSMCDSDLETSDDGDCVYFYDDGDTYEEVTCPSYDRLGRAVTADDCTCWYDGVGDCDDNFIDVSNYFDLTNEFFAGAGGGGSTFTCDPTAGSEVCDDTCNEIFLSLDTTWSAESGYCEGSEAEPYYIWDGEEGWCNEIGLEQDVGKCVETEVYDPGLDTTVMFLCPDIDAAGHSATMDDCFCRENEFFEWTDCTTLETTPNDVFDFSHEFFFGTGGAIPDFTCDPDEGTCDETCEELYLFDEWFWSAFGWTSEPSVCKDEFSVNWYNTDTSACEDEFYLGYESSTGLGGCVKTYKSYGAGSTNIYCPTAEFVGRAVTADDCVCEVDDCAILGLDSTDLESFFNFDHPLFADYEEEPPVGCEAWQWQCDNLECIDSSGLCDLFEDCTDGSDEGQATCNWDCSGSLTCNALEDQIACETEGGCTWEEPDMFYCNPSLESDYRCKDCGDIFAFSNCGPTSNQTGFCNSLDSTSGLLPFNLVRNSRCEDSMKRYVVYKDSYCDSQGVSGTNGPCAEDPNGVRCPSYERKGGVVNSGDCSGNTALFDLTSPFFTGGSWIFPEKDPYSLRIESGCYGPAPCGTGNLLSLPIYHLTYPLCYIDAEIGTGEPKPGVSCKSIKSQDSCEAIGCEWKTETVTYDVCFPETTTGGWCNEDGTPWTIKFPSCYTGSTLLCPVSTWVGWGITFSQRVPCNTTVDLDCSLAYVDLNGEVCKPAECFDDCQIYTGDEYTYGAEFEGNTITVNADCLPPELNNESNLSIFVDGCDYYETFYFPSNHVAKLSRYNATQCTPENYPNCTNILCNGRNVNFTVPDFNHSYGAIGFKLPDVSEFTDGETTDFNSVLSTLDNVSEIKLVNVNGKIRWTGGFYASAQNFDDNVEIGDRFVFVNSSGLGESYNTTATVTIEDVTCSDYTIYYSDAADTYNSIISEARVCPVDVCTNIDCTGSTLTFDVPHFSAYAVALGGDSALTIDNDGPKEITQTITFNATYINLTSGDLITGAECNISFSNNPSVWIPMTEQADTYDYSTTFGTAGAYDYTVNCSAQYYSSVNVTDSFVITSPGAPGAGVPEFSDITMLIAIVVAVCGFFVIRRDN